MLHDCHSVDISILTSSFFPPPHDTAYCSALFRTLDIQYTVLVRAFIPVLLDPRADQLTYLL